MRKTIKMLMIATIATGISACSTADKEPGLFGSSQADVSAYESTLPGMHGNGHLFNLMDDVDRSRLNAALSEKEYGEMVVWTNDISNNTFNMKVLRPFEKNNFKCRNYKMVVDKSNGLKEHFLNYGCKEAKDTI